MNDAEEQAMIERLARFMGWTKSKPAPVPRGVNPDELRWWVKDGAPVANVAEWNPLTDANADVQVLQRAREVWAADSLEWRRFAMSYLSTRPMFGLSTAPEPAGITVMHMLRRYQTGDYARAVDAVLTTTAESEGLEDG